MSDDKAEAAMAGDDPVDGGKKDDKEEKADNRICVYARLRPVNKRDQEGGNFEHIVNLHPDKKTISLTGGKTYVFDGTFGEKSEQIPVWKAVGKPVVENVFKGYCGCMMAYGQTGTGKSHTMSNMTRGQEGVIMQSMMHIFQKMEEDTDRQYEVNFSYLQLYLDKVQDLMDPGKGNLDIVRNDSGDVSVPGLTARPCNSREEFIKLYEEGDQHRVVAATKMNPVSSRSHSCLMIQIKSAPKGDDGTGESREAKMWMIDLAGYERFSKTGVLEGIRKEEAKGINASLLSLGNVIAALAEKQSHVPWRNSKLTRLLQDAIGGKAKASVCITLGPAAASFHETVGTLYFGSRAMAVKTNAMQTTHVNYAELCKKLEAMLVQEQEKVTTLEEQAEQRQLEAGRREQRMQAEMARLKQRHEEQLKALIESGADPKAIEELMKQNEAEIEIVEEQQVTERLIEEERLDEEMKELVSQSQAVNSQEMEKQKEQFGAQISEIEKQLAESREEVERLKKKDDECKQLNSYITELKEEHAQEVLRAKEEGALNSGVSKEGLEQLKVEYDKQVKSIRTMMETTHEARLAEIDEVHAAEVQKLRRQLEETQRQATEDYDALKASLTEKYEDEIAKVKARAADVQEKLKRNHIVIKNSYQEQKERLKEEIKQLKDSHGAASSSLEERGREDLQALTEKHKIVKKTYQEQVERLKKEIKQLKEALEKGGSAPPPAAHVDPAGDDDDAPPPGEPPADADDE